jgi:heme/copper-type cytochrome/quinol oxidase subunit 3
LELEPGVIFAIVAGAAMLLIVGTGVAIAGGLYTLDRTVRRVRTGSPTTYNPDPKPGVREPKPVVVLEPSPTTQMMASRGYADVAPTLGERHTKLGMWIFLSSEIMFFTALIATFLYFRLRGLILPEELGHFLEPVHIGTLHLPFNAVILVSLNTFILLASSFAVVLALDSLLDRQYGKVTLFLTGVLLLGAVFVSIQAIEWNGLLTAEHPIMPSNSTFGTIFFTMTGFHGLHVIGGLVWVLLFLLPRAFRGTLTRENVMDVELFGLYWHFVDIVWIVLFTVIYLIR